MKLALALVLALSLICSPIALPQEKLSAEDILRWFPLDMIEAIEHINRDSLLKAQSYKTFKYFATSGSDALEFFHSHLPIPERFQATWHSATFALKVRIFVYEFKKGMKIGDSKRYAGGARLDNVGDKTYVAESTGNYLGVYRYDDLDSLIKIADKEGVIQSTGIVFDKRKVFTSGGKAKKRNVKLFLYPSVFQELLVCENLELLKRMIASGYGQESNILEEQMFVELSDMVPSLGPRWSWNTPQYKSEIIYTRAEKDGISLDEIEKSRRSWLIGSEQWWITSHELSKNYTRKEIRSFESDEIAAEKARRLTANNPTAKFPSGNERPLGYNHEDNLLINTTVFTAEFMEEEKKRRSELQEEKETEAKKDQQDR